VDKVTETTGPLSNDLVVIGVIVVGFVAVPMVASWAPELVNSLLMLLLVGALMLNSARWLPYLSQFGDAISTTSPNVNPSTGFTVPKKG